MQKILIQNRDQLVDVTDAEIVIEQPYRNMFRIIAVFRDDKKEDLSLGDYRTEDMAKMVLQGICCAFASKNTYVMPIY